jgi:hypothetical protein
MNKIRILYFPTECKIILTYSENFDCLFPYSVLPSCINAWSENDVITFLHDAQVGNLLSVCQGMKGSHLLYIYIMCQNNPESMFKTLQTEINAVRPNEPLTLLTYVRFLDAVKKYIPVMNPQK